MDLEWYLRLVILGITYWVLILMMLQDIGKRKRVLGNKKWPWAMAIMLVGFLGPLLYLACHPQVFFSPGEDGE